MTKASDNVFPKIIESMNTSDPAAPSDSSWKVYAKANGIFARSSNSVVGPFGGGLSDQGVVTYLDFTTAAAPSSPASGKVRVYSKTGDHLAQKDSGGTETLLDQSGGGGAPTTAEYITSAFDGTLSAEVAIPGLAGDPDRAPSSANANDHEFDSSTIGGTALGSPTTIDADTTVPSHLYIKKAAGTGENLTGRYWSYTPTNGDIIVAKLSDHTIRADFASCGVGVAEATPGKVEAALLLHIAASGTWRADATQWSGPTGTSTGIANTSEFRNTHPVWLAIRYNSSTSLDYFVSFGGHLWRTITSAHNPSFTVGAICLFVNPVNASNDIEAVFDYVRVRTTLIV